MPIPRQQPFRSCDEPRPAIDVPNLSELIADDGLLSAARLPSVQFGVSCASRGGNATNLGIVVC
jgi:hypothetical protein